LIAFQLELSKYERIEKFIAIKTGEDDSTPRVDTYAAFSLVALGRTRPLHGA